MHIALLPCPLWAIVFFYKLNMPLSLMHILIERSFFHLCGSITTPFANLDDWLTVHGSVTLVNFQLDAQHFLYIYIKYIY